MARGAWVVFLSLAVQVGCGERRGSPAAGAGGSRTGGAAGSSGSVGTGNGGASGGGVDRGTGGAMTGAGGAGGEGAGAGGTGGEAAGAGGSTSGQAGSGPASAGGAGASGGNTPAGQPRFVSLGPIVPSNRTAAALSHTVTVTGASRDGAVIAGLSSYYDTTSSAEGATRFYWTEGSGVVSLAPGGATDIGLYDSPRVSSDGSAMFGYLVRTKPNGPGSTITYPYAFYRWTQRSGYQPFGPSPEVADGHIYLLSDDGTVALGLASVNPTGDFHPFRWTLASGYQRFDGLPGWPRMGDYVALSRDGKTILGLDPPNKSFLWSASGAVPIPALTGYSDCFADLLSGDGTVVFGYCFVPGTEDVWPRPMQRFRWTAATGTVAVGAATQQFFRGTTTDGSVAMGGNDERSLARWTTAGGLETLQPPDTAFSVTDYWFEMTATSLSEDGGAAYGMIWPRSPPTEPGYSGTESFRWSTRDGFVRLRPLPGDDVSLIASASADGSVHTGHSKAGVRGKGRAVLWDRLGARDIAAELTAAGVSLDGAELMWGSMVWSGPMIKVVGAGESAGNRQAWIAWLPAR